MKKKIQDMKKITFLIVGLIVAHMAMATKLFLAPDQIYYFPYPDGTASVSGTKSESLTLNIPTFIDIPDSCIYAEPINPAHMSRYKVTIIGENAFMATNHFTKVTLPDSLERIDDMAFYGCSKMQIPSFPETLKEIGSYAFFNCTQLVNIDLPNIEKLGQQAFMRCTQLQNVVLGDKLDTLSRNVFSADSQLETLVLGSGLKSVETNSLSRCYLLKSITCRASVPPTMDSKALQHDDPSQITLYVPCETEKLYAAAVGWKDITKIVAIRTYDFSVSAADDLGTISIIHEPTDCNEFYAEIEAVPNTDYVFTHWSDGTTDAHYKFFQVSDTNLVAYFAAVEKDTVRNAVERCENTFPFYWAEGEQMIYSPGTYTYNKLGAPTVQEITVRSLESTVRIDVAAKICEGESFVWRDKNYTEEGMYYDTLVNRFGCDSVLALDLTVSKVSHTLVERQLCSGQSVEFRGDTYTESGEYVYNLVSASGCDSIITLLIEEYESYTLTTSVECFKGTINLGAAYGEVVVDRSGICGNTVTLTAIATDDNYHFSHYRLGKDADAPATATNPLVIELEADMHVRVIIYDNDRTSIDEISTSSAVTIYDLQGRVLRQGENATTDGLQPGVYLIETQGIVRKMAVAK